jgi:hypothetical protein
MLLLLLVPILVLLLLLPVIQVQHCYLRAPNHSWTHVAVSATRRASSFRCCAALGHARLLAQAGAVLWLLRVLLLLLFKSPQAILSIAKAPGS